MNTTVTNASNILPIKSRTETSAFNIDSMSIGSTVLILNFKIIFIIASIILEIKKVTTDDTNTIPSCFRKKVIIKSFFFKPSASKMA